LKFCGYIYHQGTYTHQAGTEKCAGIFTVKRCKTLYNWNKTPALISGIRALAVPPDIQS